MEIDEAVSDHELHRDVAGLETEVAVDWDTNSLLSAEPLEYPEPLGSPRIFCPATPPQLETGGELSTESSSDRQDIESPSCTRDTSGSAFQDGSLGEAAEAAAEDKAEGSASFVTEELPTNPCPKQAMSHGLNKSQPITDEGAALSDALREARAALDYARQFVTSPSLDGSAAAPPAPVEHSQPSPGQSEGQQDQAKASAASCTNTAIRTESVPTAASASTAGYPRSFGALCANLEASMADDAVNDTPTSSCQDLETPSCPSHDHINALHARFGQSAAKARAAKARSEERARSVDLERERRHRSSVQRDTEEAAKSEPLRRRAARRVRSEQRARHEEQKQLAEAQAMERARLSANAEAATRYRRSAVRRVRSEQQQRQALAEAVLSDLQSIQTKRHEEDATKGDKLQSRCRESDWSECTSVLKTQPGRKQHTPTSEAATRLPRIAPNPRIVHANQSLQTSNVPCLPPLMPR